MKTNFFNRPWRASPALRGAGTAVLSALLLATAHLMAMPSVSTLTGGPSQTSPPWSGYVDGDTALSAQFNYPIGLALDSTGDFLFVADRDNNAVRVLDLAFNETFTFAPNSFTPAGVIDHPVGVAVDADDNLYVLNRGNGNNGTLVVFDYYGDFAGTSASALVNANAITLDSATNAYVTAGSTLIQITPGGVKTTVATVTNAGAVLQGLVVMDSGKIAVCDSGRHGIYLITTNGVISTNTGFNGVGDYTGLNNRGATKATAKFNQPTGLAKAGNGYLVVADFGNHRVKVVNSTGVVTNLYGVSSSFWYTDPANPEVFPGWWDGTVVVPDQLGDVEARLPNGLLLAPSGLVYVTEDYYHLIRTVTGANLPPVPPPPSPRPGAPTILTVLTSYGQVGLTWSGVAGTSITYNVKRAPSEAPPYTTIASTSATNYTDTSVLDGATYYYVVSAVGAGGEGSNSAPPFRVTLPLPPVPDPKIGYVDFPATGAPFPYTSLFHPVSSFVLNNDAPIVIVGTNGSQIFYNYGPTSGSIPDPTTNSASAPVGYENGLSISEVAYYEVAEIMPDLTIKAMGAKADGSPNSAIVQARFQFVAANPLITGNNAAQFTVSDITTNAQMWYTSDGSDPTNAAPSVGPIPSGTTLSLQFPAGSTNLTFRVVAFRANYQPSAVVSARFSSTNFTPNSISFGFASGEASSAFVGSPGQVFYAPVTLTTLPGTRMYSLQFSITVTNGSAAPAVMPGDYVFQSMLMKPVVPVPTNYPPGFALYTPIPPYMFIDYVSSPPPPSQIVPYYNGLYSSFMYLETINTNLNLLGVGWLERYSQTNLYNTLAQDLITYSMAHDDLFPNPQQPNGVIVGGYGFRIPTNATSGQTYQIQIGRPSATSDGVGAPGSDVYIATPTNGSLTTIKNVTVGQIKYLVGDCAPFGWFNAGDFGTGTNLDNSDVMQVFQSAIYALNYPPPGSDFNDSMDSCGGIGVLDTSTGYYTNKGPLTLGEQNAMFDGGDPLINSMAFGSKPQTSFAMFAMTNLDVCDVYVTFRRSLDPSLTWFRRFWTNGVLEAEAGYPQPNLQAHGYTPLQPKLSDSFLTNPPSINFAAADFTASAGQTLQIPITAKIFGDYPLRVLMLNLSVEPLDGSPGLTTPIQFKPNAALGTAAMTSSTGNGNYAATWLNSTIAGLTGNATLGTLTVTIPANAPSSAAYAIHFDHASASPNGIASFPKQTLTGLILLSDRSSSIYGDGIPDSWRLRYFGTVNNILSQASADADGDGASNWHEYIAGTDPTDRSSVLHVSTDQAVAQQKQDCVVRWPSVAGKRYLIERSTSLFGANWIPVSTNTGSGADMEFHDTNGGTVRFYRVHVTP